MTASQETRLLCETGVVNTYGELLITESLDGKRYFLELTDELGGNVSKRISGDTAMRLLRDLCEMNRGARNAPN